MRAVPVWIPRERIRSGMRGERSPLCFKVPLNEALSPPSLHGGQRWKGCGRTQQLPAANASDCMMLKKKKKLLEKEAVLGQWVLLLKSSPLSLSTYVIESLMGLKTGARLTRSTNEQTAQSEKPRHSLWAPTGRFSWMARNDDYYGRHMNAIWCNPYEPPPPDQPQQNRCIRAQTQHFLHATDDSFSNFIAKTWGQSILIIVPRLERCMLSF